jgi:hypothetical protein
MMNTSTHETRTPSRGSALGLGLGLGLGALLALGACSGDAIDTPTQTDYDEVAQSTSPVIVRDMASNRTAIQVTRGSLPLWLVLQGDGTLSGDDGALHWSIALTCFDAQGTVQVACGETTDRADLAIDVDGTLTLGGWDGSLDAHRHWTLSGLTTDTVGASGTTSVQASSTFESMSSHVMRSFASDYDGSYDLSIPADDPALARGSIHGMVVADRTGSGPGGDASAHFEVTVDVTLDGSGIATVSLDGTARYRLDLHTGAVTRL